MTSLDGDGPCADCGSENNIIWFTDNVFWNAVVREDPMRNGYEAILCIRCFVASVERMGYSPVGWRVTPAWRWTTTGGDMRGGELAKSTTPHRVQLRRTKGWRKPADTVVVARPSKWGNPYRIGEGELTSPRHVVREFREDLVAALERPWSHPIVIDMRIIAESIDELHGKNLACWCPLNQPCHADVLLELANHPPHHHQPIRPRRGGAAVSGDVVTEAAEAVIEAIDDIRWLNIYPEVALLTAAVDRLDAVVSGCDTNHPDTPSVREHHRTVL